MIFALALCLATIIFTYAGYPLVIALLARAMPKPVRAAAAYEPTVTVCLPIHNAATFLEAKMASLFAQEYPKDKLEFLLFSDGSSDDSDEIITRLAQSDSRIRLIRSEHRVGKPSALNAVAPAARGDVLLMTDARQPLSANATRMLTQALADETIGCATGNLVMTGGSGAGVYWRYEKWIRINEGRFRSLVGATGALYVIRARDFSPIPVDTLLDDMWIPMRIRLDGRRIVFCEDAVAFDEAFEDDREFGRKVRTLAGNFQLFHRMPKLLVPFLNPSWFETFSHKILRLLCPFALVGLVVFNAAAVFISPREWLLVALLGGQGAFYALAAIGKRAGKLGSLARTFVVLNAAAALGLFRYVRGRQAITW